MILRLNIFDTKNIKATKHTNNRGHLVAIPARYFDYFCCVTIY